jgi:hypothetical protein
VWLGHWYSAGAWQALNTAGTHEFATGIGGIPASLYAAQKHLKVYQQSGIPVGLMVSHTHKSDRSSGSTGTGIRSTRSTRSIHSTIPITRTSDQVLSAVRVEPYPLPACNPNGGSSIPPVVQHTGDIGPGRITEPGFPLANGHMIYVNITVRNNTVVAKSSTPYFLDVGAADGLVVEGNLFYAENSGNFTNDIYIYSSKGFDAAEISTNNKCGHVNEKAAVGPCVVQGTDASLRVCTSVSAQSGRSKVHSTSDRTNRRPKICPARLPVLVRISPVLPNQLRKKGLGEQSIHHAQPSCLA